jgi:ABC-type Na+ transport system ATPase subunit NatA
MEVLDNAVHVQNLTKRFGDFAAVENISFSIPKGEIFGLLGPNGAGKTTTIRMLCGILESTEGSGCVLGYDINKQPEEIKKRIGYMSQKFSLYNDLTAGENIRFYASIYGIMLSLIWTYFEKRGIAKVDKQIFDLEKLYGQRVWKRSELIKHEHQQSELKDQQIVQTLKETFNMDFIKHRESDIVVK